MAEFYSYEGLRTSGTFKVADDTKTAIMVDPKQLVGKVVALTGNYEIGYGSDGDAVFGVVETVEKESTNSTDLVVAVSWAQTYEGISCAGTETAGDYLTVDGKGGVKTSTTATNTVALGVDTTAKTCTIKVV